MGHFGKRGHFEGIPVGGPFSDEKNSKNTPPPRDFKELSKWSYYSGGGGLCETSPVACMSGLGQP